MKHPAFRLHPVAVALFLSGVVATPAQEVRLAWMPTGASAKFGYYMPQRLTLGDKQPERLKKMPGAVTRAMFGEISIGPRESPRKVIVLVDEPAGGEQRLWVDKNGNGDLTDDPTVKWTPRTTTRSGQSSTTYNGEAELQMPFGTEQRPAGISLYRFDPAARADAKTMLLYYRQWGYAGEVILGGKTYQAMLDDALASGDFRGKMDDEKSSGVFLLLDVNGDGKFDSRAERFDVRKPFNIGGTSYELAGLTASGAGLKIVKSDKAVEETKPAVALVVGGKPPAFSATTTAGKTVKFPDDYKGKVVLLDFWATWCAPCRAELPNLKKVHEEFQPRGFEVLGVSLDNEQTVGKLGQFAKDNGMAWSQIADGKGWDAAIARLYNVRSIPACIIVNGRTGTITALTPDARGANLGPSVAKALGLPAPVAARSTRPPSKDAPEPDHPTTADPLLAKAAAAVKAGQLTPTATLVEQRKSPTGGAVRLPPPATRKLEGRDIARRARESYLRVGWYYQCSKCSQWHLKLAGGYAVSRDAIATAWHVLTPPDAMKEGYALAVDSAENLVPISGVIAADQRMDAIIVRAGTTRLKPLALNTNVEVGDAAFCLSDPVKQRNYFSAGIVNRFRQRGDNGSLEAGGGGPADLRMNVSTDWGPGSSGAAVLDMFGNVIGHVTTITPLKGTNTTAYMTLHDAVPAGSVRALLVPTAKASR